MKVELYNDILKTIKTYNGSGRKYEIHLRRKFPCVSEYTIGSIYSLEYQRKMKRNHQKFNRIAEELYERYQTAVECGETVGVLLRLSEEIDLSPALLARMILERFCERNSEYCSEPVTRGFITKLMKDTTLIEDRDLAYEVFLKGTRKEPNHKGVYISDKRSSGDHILIKKLLLVKSCIVYDDQYGSITDCIKHSLGQEYELRLQRLVKDLNLAFHDEEHLRQHGYDKTPDIKLEIPVAVDGFVVNWIESKALFGDEEAHNAYFKDQYLSYWNRFGPGLVIYWFGYVETLEHHTENCIIISEDFPTNITVMDPKSIEPSCVQVEYCILESLCARVQWWAHSREIGV